MNYLLLPCRYIFLIFWTILMISTSMVIMLVTWNRKIPVIMARTMFSPGILWGCGINIKIKGTEHLKKDKPYIFVSNHMSYLDIPVLFRAIPHNLHFIAKKEVKMIPFIGWYMMGTGMIFVDRSNKSKARVSLEKAAQLIKKGKDVLMFPEGTRSRNGELINFKAGAFKLSIAADVEVVPVAITGTEIVLKPGRFMIIPSLVNVNIGEPLSAVNENIGELNQKTRTAVAQLLNEIETS